MHAWLLLLIVAVGDILLGAVPLLFSVERRPRARGRGIRDESHEFAFQRRNLMWLCLLPLMVYLLSWSSVGASLSWLSLLVGGALLAIAVTMVLCMCEFKRGGGHGTDVF